MTPAAKVMHARFAAKAVCLIALAAILLSTAFGTQQVFATEKAALQEDNTSAKVMTGYPDVCNASEWFFDSVYLCKEAGTITGYSTGTFGPSDTLTRAQAAVILWRSFEPQGAAAYCQDDAANLTGMEDVADAAFYTGAANWAVSNGIINGKEGEDGKRSFDPDGPITREQLCVIMANAAEQFLGVSREDANAELLNGMPDAPSVSSWATQSVAWGLEAGLIKGASRDGKRYVDPLVSVNRATMAAILINGSTTGLIPSHQTEMDAYWIDAGGKLIWFTEQRSAAKSRLITPDECGFWAYAKADGTIVRNEKYTAEDGKVYLANAEGELASPGWKVTGDYTNGALQRYYIDQTEHACIPGYSTDGYAHYTLPEGYVARLRVYHDGYLILADNDGLILTCEMKAGWTVTDKLDGSYQRYYLQEHDGCLMAVIGLFEAKLEGESESALFWGVEDQGYVLRGQQISHNGTRYVADATTGKLATIPDALASACDRAGISASTLSAGQIVLVSSSGTSAQISFYQRLADGSYSQTGTPATTSGYVGSNGVGQASEWTSTTPAGLFNIPFAFGVSANPGTAMEYHQTTGSSYWVDDPDSDWYNTWVEHTYGWSSAEYLDASPHSYAYGFVIGYNNPGYLTPQGATPGAGSAFFFHCDNGSPTAGCVSVSTDKMIEVLRWLDPGKSPHILIV